jgi:flagellar hook assembly protein FlgD
MYDALGNIIMQGRDMARTTGKRLIYIWDGRNEQGRPVGSGQYVAIVSVTVNNGRGVNAHKQTFKTLVGVKQ